MFKVYFLTVPVHLLCYCSKTLHAFPIGKNYCCCTSSQHGG